MKERIKSTGFWVGLLGSVFLILGAFGVEIGDETASAVVNAVCSALVLFGIVTPPKSAPVESDEQEDKEEDTD